MSEEVKIGFSKESQAAPKKVAAKTTTATSKKAAKPAAKKPTPKAKATAKKEVAPTTQSFGELKSHFLKRSEIQVDWKDNGRDIGEKQLKTELLTQDLPSLLSNVGQLYPVLVEKTAKGYKLKEGFRRIASFDLLAEGKLEGQDWKNNFQSDSKTPTIWAIEIQEGMSEVDKLLLEMAANSHRQWSATARVKAVGRLAEMGKSKSEIARALSLSDYQTNGYLDIANNEVALSTLQGLGKSAVDADSFNAEIQIGGSILSKKLSPTTIQMLATSARQVAVESSKAELTEIEAEKQEAITAEEVFVKTVEKAEEIAGDGKVTQTIAKQAIQEVEKELGVDARGKNQRKEKTFEMSAEYTAFILKIKGEIEKKNLNGWRKADEDFNPYAAVFDALLASSDASTVVSLVEQQDSDFKEPEKTLEDAI